MIHQKSKSILNAITPSNRFKIGKAEKHSGFGVSFANEGRKQGRNDN
jgi:hypothetical protein